MIAMGLDFEVIPSNYIERLDSARSPQEVSEELGLGKAEDVANKYPDAYVIGSDTIVSIDGRQVAKPANPEEAKKMLRDISGRSHDVITSVALVCVKDGIKEVKSDTATITFAPLSDELIAAYIATGDPYDKAGGYAYQHPLLNSRVVEIRGDRFTVTGLPLKLLRSMLETHGIKIPNDVSRTRQLFEATDVKEQNILI